MPRNDPLESFARALPPARRTRQSRWRMHAFGKGVRDGAATVDARKAPDLNGLALNLRSFIDGSILSRNHGLARFVYAPVRGGRMSGIKGSS